MVTPERPNPDELLARVAEESRQERRGRLKIFFGAAPGVGKTFAMLEDARIQRRAGRDVVVGVVETHGRKDTQALLDGLEVLPRRGIAHRGIQLAEFDLEAALQRRPQLLLVDELAHTNAPGSRHLKRWQDVLELIDSGIDVYTTLNVQHLDSLSDVVAQITGVTVRETIPDSVLDRAGEIELIDLPADELRARLEEGKVYIPEQARRASESFFRPGNLIALRELALRRTADRVDAQMRNYRRDNAIQSTWPVKERLLVSIGPSPYSAKLIRATKRMADQLDAEWIVAFVETPSLSAAGGDVRQRISASLRLAEQLGAETITLSGNSVADSLLPYARSRNVSRIVVGKQPVPLWRKILRGSVLDELVAKSGEIEIVAISGGPEIADESVRPEARRTVSWREYAQAAAIVAGCTLAALALRSTLNPVNLVMFYLLGVVVIATRSSRRAALFASLLSVAAFDFFCVPPYLTFAVTDYEYLVTFAVMLVVAVLIGTLTVRVRLQAAHAAERESRTQALYRLTRVLAGETGVFDAARAATSIGRDILGADVIVFFPDDGGKISFRRRTADRLPVPPSEEGIAQWVFDHAQKAGQGQNTLPGATALYVPLRGSQSVLGVMAVAALTQDQATSPEQMNIVDALAGQTAGAIERAQATTAARETDLKLRTEEIRTGLLSAVSHDLRTPLAGITGAASSLLSQGGQLDASTQRELIESIESEAERLSRLVNNLLEMTRLESGSVEVRRELFPLEELVGSSLGRLEKILSGREIATRIPEGLPPLYVDGILFEQVLLNVLENVAKYTPAGSPIEIAAAEDRGGVRIEIADRGPGFAEGEEHRIWEKFYRGKAAGARGAGLGLAISRAIVTAHAGSISAENRPDGGAVIRTWIPSRSSDA